MFNSKAGVRLSAFSVVAVADNFIVDFRMITEAHKAKEVLFTMEMPRFRCFVVGEENVSRLSKQSGLS